MKPLSCLLVFAAHFLFSPIAFSDGYANIKAARWSADESQFVLAFDNAFDTGKADLLQTYQVDQGAGRLLKSQEDFMEGDDQPSPTLKQELAKLQRSLRLVAPRWLAKDPLSFANQEWPCCYPPKLGGHYEQSFRLNGQLAKFILDTTSDGMSRTETGYRLSVQIAGEKTPRVLEEWKRPHDHDPNQARNFTLGAVGLSPSGHSVVVLVRRFDYGFESSDAVPVPFFYPVKVLIPLSLPGRG